METEYRERAMEDINNEVALALFDKLCEAVKGQPQGLTDAAFALIVDVCALEQTKQELLHDVRKRGVVEEYRNGRQVIKRPNKSVERAAKLMEQQRKHLAELGLTPKKGKSVTDDDNNGADEFAEF